MWGWERRGEERRSRAGAGAGAYRTPGGEEGQGGFVHMYVCTGVEFRSARSFTCSERREPRTEKMGKNT